MQIVCIHCTVFELGMRKKKEKEQGKKNKFKIFMCNFVHSEQDEWNFVGIFYIRIAKGFHVHEFCISLLYFLTVTKI